MVEQEDSFGSGRRWEYHLSTEGYGYIFLSDLRETECGHSIFEHPIRLNWKQEFCFSPAGRMLVVFVCKQN